MLAARIVDARERFCGVPRALTNRTFRGNANIDATAFQVRTAVTLELLSNNFVEHSVSLRWFLIAAGRSSRAKRELDAYGLPRKLCEILR